MSNHTRKAWYVKERKEAREPVANGEIGMAVLWASGGGGKPSGLKIEFSTQPGKQFTFWASELNSDSDKADRLELAYAVTIHKAQGSQFAKTLVVIPNPCGLVSPELLYTAMTRQRDSTVLFIQGDPNELRLLADPRNSATAARLTCLFRPPDPYSVTEARVLDGNHVHRTAQGDFVISKSEVIVGDPLTRLGIEYEYEAPLLMADGTRRLPDFTIRRPDKPPVYWEHLGMLDNHGYRADWDAKVAWYSAHGILPWTVGGGENGTLVWSTEKPANRGIDSNSLEALAREVFSLT